MEIELDIIRTDGGTQPRAQLDLLTVQEYATAMRDGAIFPPVLLFFDGESHWLADGFHRLEAAREVGRATLDAEIRAGSQRDAVLYSVGANGEHGLRRTNADKRQAVMTMLNDEEWGKWSDAEIARRCHVSAAYVGSLRSATINVYSYERTYQNRNGRILTIHIANIGRGKPPEPTVVIMSPARPVIPMVSEPEPPTPAAPVLAVTQAVRYPLPIVVNRATWELWQSYKASINQANDTAALIALLKQHYSQTSAE